MAHDDVPHTVSAKDETMPPKSQNSLKDASKDYERTDSVSSKSSIGSGLPIPPDGGWGWVVCFGSFLAMLILDGLLFSFGVFFMELLMYFKEGTGKTALVGSMIQGMHLIAGPLVSGLVNKYGIRRVTIAGGLVTSASLLSSSFAPSVDFLIISYGVIGGLGISMIYLPAVLAVGFYFEKKRALANGIASSGSGIGTFVFSPLIEGLINSYTWRGTMLILSAVVMNTLLCGAVFRPIEPIRSKRKADKTDDLIDDEKRVSLIENEQPIEALPDLLQSVPKRQLNMTVFPAIQKQLNENKTTHESHLNVDIKSPLYVHSLSTIPQNNHTGFGNLLKSTLLKQQFGSQDKTNVYRSLENGLHNVKQYRQPKASEHHDVKTNKPDDDILQNPLYRKDVFYSGSLTHLPEYVNSPSSKSYIKSMLSLPTSDSGDSTESIRSKFWRKMKRIFHQPLLKDPLFVMYMLPCVLWTSHSTIITYIPDYALSSGMSKSQAAMLISVIGITNTVGRIFIGWFADRDYVNCIILNALALLIAGSATMVLPFLPSYWYMLTYASIFGLCMSTWVSLRPIILVELLGIEQLTSAFGLLAMFQGIAFSIGPPIAGIMYDIGQSYTSPLVASGIMFASAGILSVLLKPLLSRRNKLRHSWTSESLNSSLFDIPAKEALLVDQDEIWKHDENLEQNEILKQDEISKKDVISKQDDVWKQAEIWIKRKDIP